MELIRTLFFWISHLQILSIFYFITSIEYLRKIKNPVLVICTEYGARTSPHVMKTMANKIPKSEFVIIKNSKHMIPIENSKEINEAIKKFLSECH